VTIIMTELLATIAAEIVVAALIALVAQVARRLRSA
jgi:hypothetical protein